MNNKLLEIHDVSIEYHTEMAEIYAVTGLDLELDYGETLGLVGETGAGKTTEAKSIMRLLPENIGEVVNGTITLDGYEVNSISENEMRMLHAIINHEVLSEREVNLPFRLCLGNSTLG